jgi:hypothetical protein
VRRIIALSLLAIFLLAACGRSSQATTTAPVPTATEKGATAVPTTVAPLTILVMPADLDQDLAAQYQNIIYDLAQADGMRFQVRNTLTPEDVTIEGTSLKIVVAVSTDPGLAALTAAAPNVQFLAVGIPDLAPAANLSMVGASGVPVDQQAFLAGYIAAMVAPEWRTGILYQKDTAGGDAAKNAFRNGHHFYCGICLNPYFYQPYQAGMYPVPVGIPTDEKESLYFAYADILTNNVVKVVYVYPAIATPDLLNYISQTDMLMIGESMPGDDVKSHWIASIRPDLPAAVKKIFPELLAGQGGQIVPTPLYLSDVNPDLLSDAKLRLVQEVLDGLMNGTIGTGQ